MPPPTFEVSVMLMISIAILLLLILSAFFSGSETALTTASRPVMHRLELSGNSRAALVNRLSDKKEQLIGAILLGNNLVNILASALATSVMISIFGNAGVAYATLAMTLLIFLFAEVLPKTYAIRTAIKTALAVAPLINFVVILLSPFTIGIQLFVRGTLRAIGVDFRIEDEYETPEEELRGAIELHAGEDSAIQQERAMLRSVLDLDDVQVSEVMTHRGGVTALEADLSASDLVDQVLDSPYTRIPLWRGDPDNVVGVLHAKALLREIRTHDGDLEGIDLVGLAAEPWFIPEQTPLLDQLQEFQRRREHFALVIDEYGSLMGVVTLEDILEEIVGEIDDEHDVADTGVRQQADGSFVADGDITIRDLNRDYEWQLPDEHAATLAGLILHEARRIPDVSQSFKFHDFRFEILKRQKNQLTSIRITPPLKN